MVAKVMGTQDLSVQLLVLTPSGFFDALHFENEANRQPAFKAFRECVSKDGPCVTLDYEQDWPGESFDFLVRELELFLGLAEREAPHLAHQLGLDLHLPTRDAERLSFRYVFQGQAGDQLAFDIGDLNSFREAAMALINLCSRVASLEERDMLRITLDTFIQAESLARERSAVLLWSY